MSDLVQRLRSRAWEDRHHRKCREEAADRIEQLERELSEARKDAADLCRRAAQECEATYKTCTDIYEKAIALGAKRQAEKLAAALDIARSQKEG